MSKRSKFSENPKSKISDTKTELFEKNTGKKVDHETMNRHSKADIIDQRENARPRDNI